MTENHHLIAVIGPTASGKTAFAARLAFESGGEIISADSRQVYKYMNIGTGKDYRDYFVEDIRIPFHLIDIAEPGYKYSIFEYQRDFIKAWYDINARGRLPILCGGSGMYIEAATRRYRLEQVPENKQLRRDLSNKSLAQLTEMLASMKALHNSTDTDTIEHAIRAIEIEDYYSKYPPDISIPVLNTLYLGIIYDREIERLRITERLESRLKEGMIEEVEALLKSGIPSESLTYYGLEYKFITLYLLGRIDYDTMKSQLNTAIHQFAKRQRTWFRKMEREGCQINWLKGEWPMEKKIELALSYIRNYFTSGPTYAKRKESPDN